MQLILKAMFNVEITIPVVNHMYVVRAIIYQAGQMGLLLEEIHNPRLARWANREPVFAADAFIELDGPSDIDISGSPRLFLRA